MIQVEENKEKKHNNYLWVEKYRPSKIKDLILPLSFRNFFNQILSESEIPNLMLFSSAPGTGKSSLARALVKEIDTDYLYINASIENGIDVLRSRIEKFATSMSFNNKKKIVIMDEADGLTPQCMSAFRATIEEFHQSCRFIFTCNYITKIIEPLKSRCQLFDFNMTEKSVQDEMKPVIFKRLCGILKNEKVKDKPIIYDEDTIKKIVDTYYPDIRKMINLLQQYTKQNGVVDSSIFSYEKVDNEFYEFILNKKLTSARKYIIERNYNIDELYRAMFDNLVPMYDKDKQSQAILIIADYMKWTNQVIDKEIHFTACLLELMGI